MLPGFSKASSSLFFSKADPLDPRLGDLTEQNFDLSQIKKDDVVLFGYADDDGVALNGGRVGSKDGPDSIRKVFYKMTPSLETKFNGSLHDGGNTKGHLHGEKAVGEVLKAQGRVITLGGGHDYGYPDLTAFCEWTKSKKKTPFILNFDAHLDVRPDDKGPSSGTSFYRLLNKYPNCAFYEIGIQDWCNSKNHVDWVRSKKGKVFTLDEILKDSGGLAGFLYKKVLKNFDKKKHELAISIDIDGFPSSHCPGASQVFPLGLPVEDFYRTWTTGIIPDFKPLFMGIYEVNPLYDLDQRTAKLAAILMHSFIYKM